MDIHWISVPNVWISSILVRISYGYPCRIIHGARTVRPGIGDAEGKRRYTNYHEIRTNEVSQQKVLTITNRRLLWFWQLNYWLFLQFLPVIHSLNLYSFRFYTFPVPYKKVLPVINFHIFVFLQVCVQQTKEMRFSGRLWRLTPLQDTKTRVNFLEKDLTSRSEGLNCK